MTLLDRRRLLPLVAASILAVALAACAGIDTPQIAVATPPVAIAANDDVGPPKPAAVAKFDPKFAALYQPVSDKFPVKGLPPSVIRKGFERKEIAYATKEAPGTIVIDPHAHYLYYVMPDGRAMRYGVAVGKAGFSWSGEAIIKTKQEWPNWYPPKEMVDRHPELRPQLDKLQSGMGVAGGYRNPLGARHVSVARQQGYLLPHPRDAGTAFHRHQRLVRLHPPDQPGRD